MLLFNSKFSINSTSKKECSVPKEGSVNRSLLNCRKNIITSFKLIKGCKMLEQFVGKKVKIVVGPEGEETQFGLTVKAVDGVLISVEDSKGEVRVINTTSANFFELSPYLIGYLVLGLYLLASFFKLRYVVTDGLLTVKWWGFTWNKVPIADIKSIEKTNSPLSSPAPSFDRILILLQILI